MNVPWIRSRINERTISLRHNLEVSQTIGKGVWFSARFSSCLFNRNCKRLHEFEEI